MSLSNDLIPYPTFEGEPLHSSSDFEVHIGPWPTPMWEGQQGYHIVNKRTNVIEGVLGTEGMAIQELQAMQQQLDQATSGGGPITTDDDAAFQEMMQRLGNKEH